MINHIPASCALLTIMLLASSCSQEDVGHSGNRQPGSRIEFRASLPEVATRATEVTSASLNTFQVSAFSVKESSETPYFTDKTFKRNSNIAIYYNEECLWPDNNQLHFIAFSPSRLEMSIAGGGAALDGDRLTGFRVPQDIASQYDFVTAVAFGNLYDNEETGISLKFQHQLSRIYFKAWGHSQSYNLEIAGVRIGGVGTEGVFNFTPQADAADPTQAGVWESISKGYVEYIFRDGDALVTLDGDADSPSSPDKAVSILGKDTGGEAAYENSAMIIPEANGKWNYKDFPANGEDHEEGMYISVLLKVIDDTPYDTKGDIVFPASGAGNAIYLAVDPTDGKTVKTRLYKDGDDYFTDPALSQKYDLADGNAMVKAFGWAALPVEAEFLPGRVYTYTLNYSNGVGLRDPHDPDPGIPIISDKVLVNVEVVDWKGATDTGVDVPRK